MGGSADSGAPSPVLVRGAVGSAARRRAGSVEGVVGVPPGVDERSLVASGRLWTTGSVGPGLPPSTEPCFIGTAVGGSWDTGAPSGGRLPSCRRTVASFGRAASDCCSVCGAGVAVTFGAAVGTGVTRRVGPAGRRATISERPTGSGRTGALVVAGVAGAVRPLPVPDDVGALSARGTVLVRAGVG
ncbi:hypothetical protein [Streptomyces sp. NBC_01601]|uniref:hypothetical protein n=1 Tax=Streptomyces sp. NBC_01601 TaxID=2975892 RepID=UPI002E2901AC|nr:hypothetical protein [Streptomyces sp. NBC_01601]